MTGFNWEAGSILIRRSLVINKTPSPLTRVNTLPIIPHCKVNIFSICQESPTLLHINSTWYGIVFTTCHTITVCGISVDTNGTKYAEIHCLMREPLLQQRKLKCWPSERLTRSDESDPLSSLDTYNHQELEVNEDAIYDE